MKLAAGAALASVRAWAAPSTLKLAMGVGDYSDESLFFVRQMGLNWVDGPARVRAEGSFRPLLPPAGRPPGGAAGGWREDELAAVMGKLKSFDLQLGIAMLPGMPNVLLGNARQDEDIARVSEAIRLAGRMGIPVAEYTFTALRSSAGYYAQQGRGGASLRAFDYERIRHDPPFPELGRVSREQMWERLGYFLKAVLPVAERAQVKLALHPNDPPVPEYRGVAQPVCTAADFRELFTKYPSASNGMTLDTGVMRECGDNPVEAIRYFGERRRIHHVHFRNVRMETPRLKYLETFHDDGDVDMGAAMAMFEKVGYRYLIVPDHTPELPGDNERRMGGWAMAVGYMKGLAGE
ncbi:MAG: mannonate dehydratase [Acidobacteriota bacterium]